MSRSTINVKKNSYTAAILVAVISVVLWFIFNLMVDAYPQRVTTFQTPQQATPATVAPLDYHYTAQP
jgi:hypothetical protein